MKIRCSTLFDITQTGVSRRRFDAMQDNLTHNKLRNQQTNFETILQIISMRCQPENISTPKMKNIKLETNKWGHSYTTEKNKICVWEFTFDVFHDAVFDNGVNPLGNLYSDSDQVPMIIGLDEYSELPRQLNTSVDLKNIHFEIIDNA